MKARDISRGIPLFQGVSPGLRNRLIAALRYRTAEKGEVLFRKGDEASDLYIVKRGKIKLSLSSPLGDELVFSIPAEGDYFGEAALLEGKGHLFNATALEYAELLLLDRQDFLAFLDANQAPVQLMFRSLSKRLQSTVDLLSDSCFLKVSGRFAKKLVELALMHGYQDGENIHIDLPLSQKELANLIGTSRESINKELRILRQKGLVSNLEQGICIHDLEQLKMRAH